jgi:RNA polymerase sigma-70 factor (ECF subfamily)
MGCLAIPRWSDVELVAAMIAGTPGAWPTFEERFDGQVWRAIRTTARRFRMSAEDLQDVRAVFYASLLASDKRRLRAFDPQRGAALSTWVWRLAVNATYEYQRRHLRKSPPMLDLGNALHVASHEPDPCRSAESRETFRAVSRELGRLAKRDRTFAELHFGRGMAPKHIAEEMQISVSTVHSKKCKLIARLSACIDSRESR